MPNPFIGVRIPIELNEALIARMQKTGQSKSEVVISALKSYLGMPSFQERLDAMEQRISELESVVGTKRSSTHHQSHHLNHSIHTGIIKEIESE